MGTGILAKGVNMKTKYVLYHANCYDGFGAAYAAFQKFGFEAEYWAVKYGDNPPDFPSNAEVYICDFSYPRKVLLDLKSKVSSLHVFDHHKTAEVDLNGLDFCVFDMKKSGAVITWEQLNPEVGIPILLKYVQDRDLWKFELPKSREVSAALRSYPMEFDVWDKLVTNNLADEGTAILKFTQQMVSIMADNAWEKEICGYRVPVTNATVFFSEVGEELCKRNPKSPFSAYYLDRKDGKRQWGLRSNSGFDCSQVAKAMGGGGHPGAAGYVEEIKL